MKYKYYLPFFCLTFFLFGSGASDITSSIFHIWYDIISAAVLIILIFMIGKSIDKLIGR